MLSLLTSRWLGYGNSQSSGGDHTNIVNRSLVSFYVGRSINFRCTVGEWRTFLIFCYDHTRRNTLGGYAEIVSVPYHWYGTWAKLIFSTKVFFCLIIAQENVPQASLYTRCCCWQAIHKLLILASFRTFTSQTRSKQLFKFSQNLTKRYNIFI